MNTGLKKTTTMIIGLFGISWQRRDLKHTHNEANAGRLFGFGPRTPARVALFGKT
jgi:hypothetical protein